MVTRTRATEIREQLGYPVLDGDGHVLELKNVFVDFCRGYGAGKVVGSVPMLSSEVGDWQQPQPVPR